MRYHGCWDIVSPCGNLVGTIRLRDGGRVEHIDGSSDDLIQILGRSESGIEQERLDALYRAGLLVTHQHRSV